MQYALKKRLEEHLIDVYLTNPSPAGIDEIGLSKRAQLANNYWIKQGKPNAIFVSLHANAFYNKDKDGKEIKEFNSARGVEVFHASNASQGSKDLAKYLDTEIFNTVKAIDTNFKDRGVKCSDFTVIYKSNMKAVLIEYGFYTNK